MFFECSAILKEGGNNLIVKRVYVGECVGSGLLSQSRKSWSDSVNNYLEKKKSLNVGQAKMMVYDRNEWWEFVSGNACGVIRGMNP